MKKVILGAAALIFAVGMHAQDAQLPSTPSQAKSLTTMGDPAGNMGESVQTGNSQKVQVQQAGTNQQVYTIQDDGTGTGDNRARVRQTGAVGPLSGVENAAEVQQSGTGNQSTTWQEGDYNEALTRQGQNDPSSEYNRARIRQGTGQNAENNKAGIDQDGDNNLARTLQTYDNSNAWTKQVGEANNSYINQNAGPDGTDGHGAEVRQTGDFNQSRVMQSGSGARNEAVTVQLGDGNKAFQTQVNTSTAGGAKNEGLIAQGDGSIGTNLNSSIFYGQLTTISDLQIGPFNGASHDAVAHQSQTGSGNDSEIHQFSMAVDGNNYAEQETNGDDNDAYIVQNAYGVVGGDNYAKQLQNGNANEAGIGQEGLNHKAYQRQFGNSNVAMSVQKGENNMVNTYQGGNNNWAQTGQDGQHNQILLVQKGGHTYTVSQNLTDGMPNGGNIADILQLGPNGNFATDGEDCIFDPELPTPSLINVPGFDIDAPCPPGGC